MELKIKATNRGGVRNPLTSKSGASRLLEALWNSLGGPSAVAEKLKLSPSVVINWRIRGKVPLKKVPIVAKTLKITYMGLNFIELSRFYVNTTWEEAVNSYKLDSKQVDWILRGKKPKE